MTNSSLPDPGCDPRGFLEALCRTAIRAASPDFGRVELPAPPEGRVIVVGAGKAAASMAAAFEARWPGPVEGLVVTRYGHACPTRSVEVVEASHPCRTKQVLRRVPESSTSLNRPPPAISSSH